MDYHTLIFAGGTLVAVGISWGDLRSKLKGLYKWAENHNEQASERDKKISALEVRQATTTAHIEDNRELLIDMNRKLDRIINRG